jgi:KEOPS complex subunit Pcc1
MLSATLTISGERAGTIYGAISPEAGREIPRTKVAASLADDQVRLRIEATDLSALRAALNSYLRWIKIAEDMNQVVGD